MDMSTFFYELWYNESVKPNLSVFQKIDVANRISELTLKNPIWLQKSRNFIDLFPELKPYSTSGHISGLQLCVVMKQIVKSGFIRQEKQRLNITVV